MRVDVEDGCNRRGFGEMSSELSRGRRLGPGVRNPVHVEGGESNDVAVTAIGMVQHERIQAVGMQPVHPTFASDDRVVAPWRDPVLAGGRPVQIDDGNLGSTNSSTPGCQKGGRRPAPQKTEREHKAVITVNTPIGQSKGNCAQNKVC